jgi:hypothetical protein
MRSIQQIKESITEVERQLADAQDLEFVAKFPGADKVRSMFVRSACYYNNSIVLLDNNSPTLAKDLARYQACLALVDSYVRCLDSAGQVSEDLRKEIVAANEELGAARKAEELLEKNRM